MDQSPRLGLPYILPNQAQKHVTHNEGLQRLDAIVQPVAISATSPSPASPSEGDLYIVPAGPAGDWAAAGAGDLAIRQDGAWMFVTPAAGWTCFVADEGEVFHFDGAGWARPDRLGINAAPDGTNRLAVSAAASLFNHAGGDHRLNINKNASAGTAALVYQSGFTGHAEIGLCGDDDFHFKVSDDGMSFTDAMQIASDTGTVTIATELALPDGVVIRNSGTAATSGAEIIGGGGLGPVSLKLVNDGSVGVAGAMFTQMSPFAGVDLVDFALKTQTQTMNLRVESRVGFVATGGTPEFQLFRNLGGGMDEYILRGSPQALYLEVPTRLASFTVAGLPAASAHAPGTMVFVSDAAGGAEPAFSDGTNWRLCSSRAVVS